MAMSITVKVGFVAAITLCLVVASLAKDNAPPTAATTGAGGKRHASHGQSRRESTDCPIVKLTPDGLVDWVEACPLAPPY
jgi:hypothetical protein